MLPELAKIIAADAQARETVARAQEEDRGLRSQADSRVQAIRDQLQEELARLRQESQVEILQQAESRAAAIAATTDQEIERLTAEQEAHRDEAVALLVSRVLGQ